MGKLANREPGEIWLEVRNGTMETLRDGQRDCDGGLRQHRTRDGPDKEGTHVQDEDEVPSPVGPNDRGWEMVFTRSA